jgi:hypothetical protein
MMMISNTMTQVVLWLAALVAVFVMLWCMALVVVKVVVASRRMPKR